jgi:hypothetical protein
MEYQLCELVRRSHLRVGDTFSLRGVARVRGCRAAVWIASGVGHAGHFLDQPPSAKMLLYSAKASA